MNPARMAAVHAVNRQLGKSQAMTPVVIDRGAMDERDHRLAQAIYRESVRRWLTIDELLNSRLRQPAHALEPMLRAVLIAGCAQIVFMDKQPVHAVVDESVRIAKKRVRPGAGGLVNAVLRKMAGLVGARHVEGGWAPAGDRIPWGDGSIELTDAVLPPIENLAAHLAVATSHPLALVEHWIETHGQTKAIELLRHSHQEAPLIVRAESEAIAGAADECSPHEGANYAVWRAGVESLGAFLEEDPHTRWVQDPTAAAAAASTASLKPEVIIDACAGRGTKTRQLAHLHPSATIIATDTDAKRYASLEAAFEGWPNIRVTPHGRMADYAGGADLIVLDVPCSNLGVLARRLEARYRYEKASIDSLVNLQRKIAKHAAAWLRRDSSGAITGRVLYSTCSIDRRENEAQADRIAKRLGLRIDQSHGALPGGADTSYHDGGYYALLEPCQETR
jgi:16S rRNA (cytosine967-C5)-methyltransferase